MMRPPGAGSPFASPVEQLPSFLKQKKKYHPDTQMKRANWTKVGTLHFPSSYYNY